METERTVGYDFIIPLIKRVNAHNEKVRQLEGIVNTEFFCIEVLDLLLDAFGVPPDNTVEQHQKYGDQANDRPDTFGRDWWYERYWKIKFNTEEEIWTFLESVRKDVEGERWKTE